MKVLVACNTLTSVGLGPYMDHNNLSYRLGRDYPSIEFYQVNARRVSIDRFRNWAAETAMQIEAEYLFFIDDDMQFLEPRRIFAQLLNTNYDIISARNYVRGYPFDPMAFKYACPENKRTLTFIKEEDIPADGVLDVEAVGTAVALIKTSVFKNMSKPFFATGPHNTEDVYFCLKAQDFNPGIKIGYHGGAITGHVLDPEVISRDTRAALLKYYESFGMKPNINIDRGESYIAKNIEPGLRNKSASE